MTAMGPPPVAAGDDEIYRSLIAGRHGGLPLLGPDLRRGDVKSPLILADQGASFVFNCSLLTVH